MTVAAHLQEDDAASAPAASPDAPAAAPVDDFDQSLKEFETATTPPPASQPEQAPAPQQPNYDEIDQLLADLQREQSGSLDGGPLFAAPQAIDPQQQRALEQFNALQNENLQLKSRLQFEADQKDFGKLTSEVQSRLDPNLPSDYARTQLIAMAAENPALVAAFDYRNVDRAAVDRELRLVEGTLQRLGRDPNANPQYVAQLTQHSYRLGLALNSREILRRATIEIGKRAAAHTQIDETATADHDAVAAAVRGSSAKASPEPPPNFGNMSDKELARFTKQNYGF
jgi:hypothetical protein